jgi:hypothetical protein
MLRGSPARPVVLFFISLTAAFIIFRRALTSNGFNVDILLIGNIILLAITLISFFLLMGGMKATNTAAFLRSVYGGFMAKFFIVAAVVFGYAFLSAGKINKPSLFTLMFLYLVYTFIEIRALMKQSKKSKNG